MAAYDPANVFARILRGEIPTAKTYEDDHVLAFPDINPAAAIHVLVIPKGAYVSLSDFTARAALDELSGFWQGVAAVIKHTGLTAGGYRLITNDGAHGGQEVPHFHVHLLGGELLGKLICD